MTGSHDGLATLTSPHGYKHYSKAELELSASQGCSCCSMLLMRALEEWPVSNDWDPRIVALDERGTPILTRVGHFNFESQKLSLLRCKKRDGNDTAVFDIFVAAAKRKWNI
jgi:hypothetical protein